MKTYIYIKTQFTAYHFWKEAPVRVAFLRDLHRHIFHVRMDFEIKEDRELEFFQIKDEVDSYIEQNLEGKTFSLSCEAIAAKLYTRFFPVFKVEVSEDEENGSYVIGEG